MFLSSGFDLRPSGGTKTQPLSQFIRRIDTGENSGQMQVSVTAFPDAYSYQVRWSPANTGGAEPTWTIRSIGKTQPPVTIESLTPGTAYVFQARALTESGFTDWSDPVTRNLDRVAAKALSLKCGRGPKRSANNHFSLAARWLHSTPWRPTGSSDVLASRGAGIDHARSDPLSHIQRHRARAYRQRARGSGGRVQSVRRPATRRSRIRDARGLAPRAMESVMD